MRANDLVKALQAAIDEHGDLEVRFDGEGITRVRFVEDIPICADGCCHGNEIWICSDWISPDARG